jgi:hypothetical protein
MWPGSGFRTPSFQPVIGNYHDQCKADNADDNEDDFEVHDWCSA